MEFLLFLRAIFLIEPFETAPASVVLTRGLILLAIAVPFSIWYRRHKRKKRMQN